MYAHSQYDEKAMVDAVARLNPVTFGFDVTADFKHYKEGVYSRWDQDLDNSTSAYTHTTIQEVELVWDFKSRPEYTSPTLFLLLIH